MNFTLVANQHGVLVPVAVDVNGHSVDSNGNPLVVTGLTAVSSDPTILTVAQDAGVSSDFDVRAQGVAGTVTITVSGNDANGKAFSTAFTFSVTAVVVADVAVGFTATLINVTNN